MLKKRLSDIIKIANELFSKIEKLTPYEMSLVVTKSKKNCLNMSSEIHFSKDKLTRLLRIQYNYIQYVHLVLRLIRDFSEFISFMFDDTFLPKLYSENLEGVKILKDGADGNFKQGFSIVVLGMRIHDCFFPLMFKNWVPKELSEENHETKIDIAISLIEMFKTRIQKSIILADGLYSSQKMRDYLDANFINYDMRIAANRIISFFIETNGIIEQDGEKFKISQCGKLKKNRNEKCKTIKCLMNGKLVFITAQFFKPRDNKPGVKYIISNYDAPAKCHVRNYKFRWIIESFFKFSKQSLGLSDCVAHSLEKQLNHIRYVFSAYIKLQIISLKQGSLSIYETIKTIRSQKKYIFNENIFQFEASVCSA